jgi:hypothetical protein
MKLKSISIRDKIDADVRPFINKNEKYCKFDNRIYRELISPLFDQLYDQIFRQIRSTILFTDIQ